MKTVHEKILNKNFTKTTKDISKIGGPKKTEVN